MSDDTELLVVHCARISDMPKARAPSIQMACDVCQEPIWASAEMIAKITELMIYNASPASEVVYICHDQHSDELPADEHNNYCCHLCESLHDTLSELTFHYETTHQRRYTP